MAVGPLARPLWESKVDKNDTQHHDNQLLWAQMTQIAENNDWYDFLGFRASRHYAQNPWYAWKGENCGKTQFNEARRKWGVVGDPEKSQVVKELVRDLSAHLSLKLRLGNSTA